MGLESWYNHVVLWKARVKFNGVELPVGGWRTPPQECLDACAVELRTRIQRARYGRPSPGKYLLHDMGVGSRASFLNTSADRRLG
jgi:hypothetical protein